CDPRTGLRFDVSRSMDEVDLGEAGGPDPRGAWELARCGHLVELGAAAALHPSLLPVARAYAAATLASFLDDNPLGWGIHWTSPRAAALGPIPGLAAIDLRGGAARLAEGAGGAGDQLLARVGASLVEHGRFLAANLEEGGMVTGSHVLGDLAGLSALGLRL